jgi:hypothetical protein
MKRDHPHQNEDRAEIRKPPKRSLKDPSGQATNNPKLPKQAKGQGSQPSASKSPDPRSGIKRP